MKKRSAIRFESVREWEDTFLSLFPHRFDYIWAEHPDVGEAVEWKTESRHPLSDRLILQGTYLYGVRFGTATKYCLLDIDTGSVYHPKQDPFAISRIVAALEPLGLVKYIVCTSSYSGGLHLYFPFQQAQSSWQLAIALACLIENAGFKIQPGQLEIFPNPKPYAMDGSLSLFNAHRLPMQIGSYLLDEMWQTVWSDSQTFVNQWKLIEQGNNVDSETLRKILKQAKRKHFGFTGKTEKFINDLNTEIELGWTGYGQTNRLLGRITMRAYVFHHILSGAEPLKGKALVQEIVETAQLLPGYREWCRHQHEIEHRAEEWARCIENSHYFHFGDRSKKPELDPQDPELVTAIENSPSWNQRQSAAARERIRWAIADLLEKNSLPVKSTARFQALLKYGIGGASLYRHRDLWHPTYFNADVTQDTDVTQNERNLSETFVELPPHPTVIKTDSQLDCVSSASNWPSPPSLFPSSGSDSRFGKASTDQASLTSSPDASNSSVHPGDRSLVEKPMQGVQCVQQVLFNIKASQERLQEASRFAQTQYQRLKSEAAQRRQIERMQQFLESDDPILIAEAMAWARLNPGVLESNRLQLSI